LVGAKASFQALFFFADVPMGHRFEQAPFFIIDACLALFAWGVAYSSSRVVERGPSPLLSDFGLLAQDRRFSSIKQSEVYYNKAKRAKESKRIKNR